MKGVILTLQPRAHLVDITHDIPSGYIRTAAFALAAAYGFFPAGTIHLVVVDPGVGTRRKALAVRTARYFFVAPDNGVLSLALQREHIKSIRALENDAFFLKPLSRTFHGRDIFAPIAAHLAGGIGIQKFGPALKDFVRLPLLEARIQKDRIEGEIVYIDRFGNAITNISAHMVSSGKPPCEVFGKRRSTAPLKDAYQSVPKGKPVCVLGSSGFLEVAINGGSAQTELGLRIGSRVTLRFQEPPR
jgi:S-adenosylmethionine hydrolase